jgi:hypothetical protein
VLVFRQRCASRNYFVGLDRHDVELVFEKFYHQLHLLCYYHRDLVLKLIDQIRFFVFQVLLLFLFLLMLVE